jgi:hypothetical protein
MAQRWGAVEMSEQGSHATAVMAPFSSPQRESPPNVTNCFHIITEKSPRVTSNWRYKNKDAGLS